MAVNVSIDEVMKFVQGCKFPSNKQDVVNCARQNGASGDVVQALQEMPDEAIYNNPADVREGIRRHREHIQH